MRENMKMKKLSAFALFFLFLIIIFSVLPVTYAINDDVAMRDIASGAMSGQPDYHLVFVKAVLGLILQAIYLRFPGMDWYGLLWMSFIVLSAALVLWNILAICERKKKNLFIAAVLFLMIFTLTALGHLVSFQFTVVAGILAGTAIFLYGVDESKGKKEYLTAALIIFLIWASFCVRENVLMMAVPFGGLMILYKTGSVKKKVLMAFIVVIGLAGIMLFEHIAYSGEEWETYRYYNSARSVVYDYYGVPPYEENKEFYNSIGFEEYDVANLERYQLVFVDELENGKMQQVAEYAKQQYNKQNTLITRIKSGIKTAILGECEKENIILNLLAKLLILFNMIWGIRHNKKNFFIINAGFLVCEGILVLYLGYEGRLPARVMAALLLIEFLSALSVWFSNQSERVKTAEDRKGYRWKTAFLFIALLILSGCKISEIYDSQTQRYRSNQEYELLQSFYVSNPENVYYIPVNWTAAYSSNFYIRKDAQVINGFNLGGWTKHLPVYEKGLERFGIENEDTAIVENENVYLILSAPSSKITPHYEEKYKEVQWTQVDTAPVYGMEVPVFKITGGDRK